MRCRYQSSLVDDEEEEKVVLLLLLLLLDDFDLDDLELHQRATVTATDYIK